MADITVSVHELKSRLSEYLGRSMHRKERIIISRRNHPIAMIVPLAEEGINRNEGLAAVPWEQFADLAPFVEEVFAERQTDVDREIPF